MTLNQRIFPNGSESENEEEVCWLLALELLRTRVPLSDRSKGGSSCLNVGKEVEDKVLEGD
jgi:hypothetical protein